MTTTSVKTTTFIPLHDRILVRRIEEGESIRGGIIIPESAKEKPMEGEVIAVGKGKSNDEGTSSFYWRPLLLRDHQQRIRTGSFSRFLQNPKSKWHYGCFAHVRPSGPPPTSTWLVTVSVFRSTTAM
jgi:hypothetical protein